MPLALLRPMPSMKANDMHKSSTADALALMAAQPGLSQAAAARLCGIKQSTVAHAVKNQKRPRCPHCGKTLRATSDLEGSA